MKSFTLICLGVVLLAVLVSANVSEDNQTPDLAVAESKHGHKSEEGHEEGGGKEHHEHHHDHHGEKGEKGHDAHHHHHHHHHGKHGKHHHAGHHHEHGDHHHHHHDHHGHHKEHHEHGHHHKGGKHGHKKGHKKGQKTHGHHIKKHYDEHHKHHKFYDDHHHDGHHHKHGHHHGHHHHHHGHHKKGGHGKEGHHEHDHGKKGHDHKGHHDHHHHHHDHHGGHEDHHHHHHGHGEKGGHDEGKHWGHHSKHWVISMELEKLLVPSHAIRNTSVTLECHYNLQGETLYSVKWYKDGNEFYRYVPRNQPPAQVFPLPGVTVDLHNSTEYSVVLSSVQLSTSGLYRCEVSGEAPFFETVTEHAHMMVVALPKAGPEITGGHLRYNPNDLVNVTCTTKESKPAAQLHWMINGEPADSKYIKGPYKQFVGREGLETTSLNLQFVVQQKHFKRGNMKLKCLATIATVYTTNNEKSYEGERQIKGVMLASKETTTLSGSRADSMHSTGSASSTFITKTTVTKVTIIIWLCLKGII